MTSNNNILEIEDLEKTEAVDTNLLDDQNRPLFSKGSHPARVLNAIQKLTNLLQLENSLLSERRIAETKSLQGEKAQLSANYQKELLALKQNPQSLGPKGSPVRRKLKEISETFQEEVKSHGRILLRLKTVSENLVHAISSEASKKSGAVPHYDNLAHMHQNAKSCPVNIAHNEII